jgi:hypothetical protein
MGGSANYRTASGWGFVPDATTRRRRATRNQSATVITPPLISGLNTGGIKG